MCVSQNARSNHETSEIDIWYPSIESLIVKLGSRQLMIKLSYAMFT